MSTDLQEPEAGEGLDTAYSRIEAAHYQEIREANDGVSQLERDYEDAKSLASAAKKAFDTADKELRKMIDLGPDPQANLPGMDGDGESVNGEPWQEMSIDELWLGTGLTEKLIAFGLITVGKLSAYMTEQLEYGEDWYRDIKGVGEDAATKISDAFVVFWAAHPEHRTSQAE